MKTWSVFPTRKYENTSEDNEFVKRFSVALKARGIGALTEAVRILRQYDVAPKLVRRYSETSALLLAEAYEEAGISWTIEEQG